MTNEFKFFRLKQALEIVSVSKNAWCAGIAEGRFPRQVDALLVLRFHFRWFRLRLWIRCRSQ